MPDFISVIQGIIALILVILLANISLRFVNKQMSKNNKMIKVVERVPVSNNSSLSIVDICGIYYLMSFTGNDNKILKELDKEEVDNFIKNIDKNNKESVDSGFIAKNNSFFKNLRIHRFEKRGKVE